MDGVVWSGCDGTTTHSSTKLAAFCKVRPAQAGGIFQVTNKMYVISAHEAGRRVLRRRGSPAS